MNHCRQSVHDATGRRDPHQRPDLDQQDDDANARHEAGHHRVGHQRDVAPQLEQSEQDLEQTANHHRRHHEGQ